MCGYADLRPGPALAGRIGGVGNRLDGLAPSQLMTHPQPASRGMIAQRIFNCSNQ